MYVLDWEVISGEEWEEVEIQISEFSSFVLLLRLKIMKMVFFNISSLKGVGEKDFHFSH